MSSKRGKAIKLLFDADMMIRPELTGVGKTTRGLIVALAKQYPDELLLIGHYYDFLGRLRHPDLPVGANIYYQASTLLHRKAANMLRRLGIPIPYELITKQKADFHLFPCFIGWPSLFRTPSATFFHDVTYLNNPEYVSKRNCRDLKKLMPGVVKRASFVITNSNSSKQGIMQHYGTAADKLLVEHIPPVDIVHIAEDEAARRIASLGIEQPFLLFFGTLEPRKNLVSLMKAYQQLPDTIRGSYTLVVAGAKGWNDKEILDTLHQLQASGAAVIQTGYVSDEDRAALFMKTSLYLMPSHYEGFGMQLLEGMTYRTPMLVSDIPVLREVAGEAAAYCGTSPTAIRQGIVALLPDTARQQAMIAAGQKRLRDFSWDKVAKDVYEKIRQAVDQ